MINISKQSWHYRWMKKIGFRHPSNLCAYFWKTVWSGLVFPVAAFAAFAAIVLLTVPFWAWFFPNNIDVQVMSILVGLMEIGGLSAALYTRVMERRQLEKWRSIDRGTYVVKKPSLFSLWLKARHEQVCPFLEFTDDK